MNILIYILFASIFVFDWLFVNYNIGVRLITWIPEIVSASVAFYILVSLAVYKRTNIPFRYIFLLLLYFFHIFVGLAINDVSFGTIVAGVRTYCKFIPLFLLPAFFRFEDRDMKKILLFILALACIQLPVVLWQRFFAFREVLSGDRMGGTLGYHTSGLLSLFLISAISFLVAFYLQKKISTRFFVISLILVFLPTTLNETKITFVLLPLAFIFPLIFIKQQRKNIVMGLFLLMIFGAVAFTLKNVYDHFQMKRWGHGISGFVSDEEWIDTYLSTRIEPMLHTVDKALNGPQMIFGHGIGNVSISFSKAMTGKYWKEAEMYEVGHVSITKLFWEIGIIGTLIFFLIVLFVFWDTLKLCKKPDFIGTFSLGMLTLTTIFVLSFFYTMTIDLNLMVFLFFFLAGYAAFYRSWEEGLESNSIKAALPHSMEPGIQ